MTYESTKVDQTWRSNKSNPNPWEPHQSYWRPPLSGLVSRGPAPRSKIDRNTPLEEVKLQGGYDLDMSGRGNQSLSGPPNPKKPGKPYQFGDTSQSWIKPLGSSLQVESDPNCYEPISSKMGKLKGGEQAPAHRSKVEP